MESFRKETIKEIGAKKVNEYYLTFNDSAIFSGGGDIDWEQIRQDVGWDSLENYDSGHGVQYWDGWISFEDGTWIERHEYDGAEWWEHKEYPELKGDWK